MLFPSKENVAWLIIFSELNLSPKTCLRSQPQQINGFCYLRKGFATYYFFIISNHYISQMRNKATSCSNLEYYIWFLYMSFVSCCSFQFFGFMSMLYLACAIGWLIASCCYWKDLLRVQVCCLFRSCNLSQLYCTIFHCTSNFTVAEMAKLDGKAKVFSLEKGRITKHIMYVHHKKLAFFGLFKTMAQRHMIQIAQNKLAVLLYCCC